MKKLIIPEHYDPRLSVRETQGAIKYIRDTFQKEFGREMNLERISAPLFVEKKSGLNDNLNGVERPVGFDMKDLPGDDIEIVQSLAKWKRLALREYGFKPGEGIYTNMNAIRRDEEVDNLHSVYVDQWDWEKVIRKEERTEETLKETVLTIFKVIKHMEHEVWYKYPHAFKRLPDSITFVTSEELLQRYPDLSCDILKLSHHGSKTGSSERFLDTVRPELAIVSSGAYSIYHHPSPEVTERLYNRRIPYLDTKEDGDITILFLPGFNLLTTASGKIAIIRV